MPDSAQQQHPGGDPTGGSDGEVRPRGERAVSLALHAHNRNPVKIAKALQGEIDRLRGLLDQRAIPDGAVLLKGDEAKAYTAYVALGKPEDLAKKLEKVTQLEQTVADREARDKREALARDAAKALGWNESVLTDFVGDKKLTIEMRSVEVDDGKGGRTIKSLPHSIEGEGANQKAVLLDAVVKDRFAGYLPALTSAPQQHQQAANGSSAGGGGTNGGGPRYTPQSGNGASGQPTSLVDEMLARNAERAKAPNALRPAAKTGA